MAAYLTGQITIKDYLKWKNHIEGVGKSLIPFGVEVMFRGERSAVLKCLHNQCVVIKLPDQITLHQWYESETCQKLIPV